MKSFAGELGKIQQQTKKLARISSSQMNVKSLCLSDTVPPLYNSSLDISANSEGNASTVPLAMQPSGSVSIPDLYKQIDSPSQGYHSKNESLKIAEEEDQQIKQQIQQQIEENYCQGCTEATMSEEKVTFLCFTWRKKKKGLTFHSCNQQGNNQH